MNKKEKHPLNFDGYNAKEFADKFVSTNYFYQERVFEELAKRYVLEAEGDKNRPSRKNLGEGRIQLAGGLEQIAEAFRGPVLRAMNKIKKACKRYLDNPYENSQKL